MTRIVISLVVTALLSACATPASHQAMTVQPPASAAPAAGASPGAGPNVRFKGNLRVESVKGGSSTNPLWTSKVDNAEFKKALEDSLAIAGYLAPSGGTASYVLNADLQKLDQPLLGLDFDVKSTVVYSLQGGDVKETIPVTATGTAGVSDAFVGVVRLRIANERAIAENIKELLRRLQSL